MPKFTILENVDDFIGTILDNLDKVGLDVSKYSIDHIGYRAASLKEYLNLKKVSMSEATLISELTVRERPIAVFELKKPINSHGFIIPYFEIMAPAKGDRMFLKKLEHVEFVVGEDYKVLTEMYPEVNFNLVNYEREEYPELLLYFPNDANVHFHPWSIKEEIYRLKRLKYKES